MRVSHGVTWCHMVSHEGVTWECALVLHQGAQQWVMLGDSVLGYVGMRGKDNRCRSHASHV